MTDAPLCPTCGQPATTALAGPEPGWECRNEACPEFGQAIQPGTTDGEVEPGPGL